MKRLARAILLASTCLVPVAAQADPVTLIGVAVSAGGALATASFGAVVGGLIGAGLSVLGALATSFLTANRSVDGQARTRTREFNANPAWRYVCGEVYVEGAAVFKHVVGQKLYMAYLVSDGKCASDFLQEVQLNDGVVLPLKADATNDVYDMTKGAVVNAKTGSGTVNKDGVDISGWGVDDSDDEYILKFWAADGTQTQPPQDWIDEIGDVIRATDTWAGSAVVFVTHVHNKAKFANVLWPLGKPPPFRFKVKGIRVYDPRLDSTSGVTLSGSPSQPSGSHRPNDESTWEWSANPALQALHFLRLDRGLSVADERILIQQFADAADDCDAQDGGVSEVQLDSENWEGSAPSALSAGTDPGSGVWTYSAGTVSVGPKDEPSLGGTNTVKVNSTDTDGTLVTAEHGRIGVYYDFPENGRADDIAYTLRTSCAAGLNGGGTTQYRMQIFEFNRGGTASASDQTTKHVPPDAQDIVEVYDSGVQTSASTSTFLSVSKTVQGRGISIVLSGGEPNESDVEFRTTTFWTTSQAGQTRFRSDGVLKIETDEWSLLDPILDSMAGFLDTTGGKIGVRAGVWDAPSLTLSEPIGDGFEYQGREDPGFAKVVPRFFSEMRDFEPTLGTAYVLKSGDRTRTLELPFVRNPEQAARIAKIIGARAKTNRTLTCEVAGSEWGIRVGDRYTISIGDFARADGIYMVTAVTPITEALDDGGFRLRLALTLREDEAATYSWGASDYTEETATTPAPPTSPSMGAPTSVVIEQNDYRVGSTATARVKATITMTAAIADAADHTRIEVDDGSGYVFEANATPAASIVVYIAPASEGATYTVRARNESIGLGESTYATSNSITIIAPVLDFDPADFSAEFS